MSVRFGLLGLLGQKPRHGYELLSAFTAVVGGEHNWEVKPAQIYTTLSRLKDGGLIVEEGIEQEGGPEKHVHAITEKGKAELREWLMTPVKSEHQRDEFFIKLMICLVTEENPLKVIYIQRSSMYRYLHDLNEQRMKTDPKTDLAHILLLDLAIMHTEADLRWLDMIESRLDDIKKQPIPQPEQKVRGRPSKAKNKD
jgi:Predicted transcriptional regulators